MKCFVFEGETQVLCLWLSDTSLDPGLVLVGKDLRKASPAFPWEMGCQAAMALANKGALTQRDTCLEKKFSFMSNLKLKLHLLSIVPS